MRKPNHPSAKRFQAIVSTLLGLPVNAAQQVVRQALAAKGAAYLKWYDTRLGAIAEFEASTLPSHPAGAKAARSRSHVSARH